jgi:uncharacterized protein (DUF488 family)
MSKIVYTGNYANCKYGKNIVSISGDSGAKAGFVIKAYPCLAPKLSFWQKWHENIGKVSEYDNNMFYIEEYYKQVLSKLDPQKVLDKINDSVLLCYEDNNDFCHRHLVAFWLEIFLGIETKEIKISRDGIFEELTRPTYLKECLEKVIRENYDMDITKASLRARYLFSIYAELYDKDNDKDIETVLNSLSEEYYKKGKTYTK